MALSAAVRPLLMTADEFLAWDSPDGSERWELINGSPQAMAPSRPRHGAIAVRTGRLLDVHLADHPHCRAIAEAGVRPNDYTVRIPDITVTCEEIGPDDLLLREPLLIVEILSPSNAADTRAAVISYMIMPSVREILVLNSMEIQAELWRREEPGREWRHLMLGQGDTVTLESIGFSAPLTAFYPG
jgi:Uma2 family endonuclease